MAATQSIDRCSFVLFHFKTISSLGNDVTFSIWLVKHDVVSKGTEFDNN